jgi:hypothetical protein
MAHERERSRRSPAVAPEEREKGARKPRRPLMVNMDDVYALLSAANLARMRGRWDEAIDKCAEALRLDPNNSTAHSLVGDIYQDQGRKEEAIQWYQMALDLDPDNTADRVKIDRLKTPPPLPAKAAPFSYWSRIGVSSAVILAFLMMSVGLMALIRFKRPAGPTPHRTSGEPPPLHLPPGLRPTTPPNFFPLPSVSPGKPTPDALSKLETPRESALHSALATRLGGAKEIDVFYVQMDPETSDATVSVFFRPESDALNPPDLLRAAYVVTRWDFQENPASENCSVRIYYQSKDRVAPEAALATTARKEIFSSARPQSAPESVAQAFQRLAWNAYLLPNVPLLKPNSRSEDGTTRAEPLRPSSVSPLSP